MTYPSLFVAILIIAVWYITTELATEYIREILEKRKNDNTAIQKLNKKEVIK